jgi:hypothetical protein
LDGSAENPRVNFRNGVFAGLVVAAACAVWVATLWQPKRQVRLHSAHLLNQIGKHDWKAVGAFVGADYQDRWANDRARLLERLREAFQILPNAQIEASLPSVRTGEGRGHWTAKIKVKSTGEFAEHVERRVNSVEEPFELEWQRGDWPWDWTLVTVRNSAFEISD